MEIICHFGNTTQYLLTIDLQHQQLHVINQDDTYRA